VCVCVYLLSSPQAIDVLLSRGAEAVIITSVETQNLPGKLVLLAKNQKGWLSEER